MHSTEAMNRALLAKPAPLLPDLPSLKPLSHFPPRTPSTAVCASALMLFVRENMLGHCAFCVGSFVCVLSLGYRSVGFGRYGWSCSIWGRCDIKSKHASVKTQISIRFRWISSRSIEAPRRTPPTSPTPLARVRMAAPTSRLCWRCSSASRSSSCGHRLCGSSDTRMPTCR